MGHDGKGVWKTSDGGTTWAQWNMGNRQIRALGVAPSNPQIVYGGTFDPDGNHDNLYVTTNGGTSWISLSYSGIVGNDDISSLLVDSSNPDTVYAIVSVRNGQEIEGGTVYRSTDGGVSWAPLGGGAPTDASVIAFDPNNASILYIGTAGAPPAVHKSTDGGGTWVVLGNVPALRLIYSIVVDPANSSVMYVGTFTGVFQSTNGGTTWIARNTNLIATPTFAVEVTPSNPAIVYAGPEGQGIYKSSDGGNNWMAVNNFSSGAPSTFFTFAVHPNNPNVVYTGGLYTSVWKTTNGGGNWTLINTGLTSSTVMDIIIDPVNTDIVYAATAQKARFWPPNSDPGGVYKSTDGGATWNRIQNGLTNVNITALAIDPTNPSILYAATYGGGIFKTMDGGSTWNPINTGLTENLFFALAISPSNPQVLYAGVNKVFKGSEASLGVWRSTDGGASWSVVGTQNANGLAEGDIENINIHPFDPNIVYVGTHGSGVFRTTNGLASSGVTWVQETGLVEPENVTQCCDAFAHVYTYSADIDSTGNVLYAGSCGRGIFRRGTLLVTPQVTLTVTKAGAGSGMVIGSPGGINCGVDCSENYTSGTIITLTAIPDPGSIFIGWGGDCSGTGSCIFTMNSAKTVTAIFITPLALSFSVFPEGEVIVAYNADLEISGGLPPYIIDIFKGSLPLGLGLGNDGVISGTPTKAGTKTFTIKVTDDSGSSVSKKLKITVFKALSISAKRLPKGKVGKKYSATVEAAGGKKPYSWSIISGSLPGGLVLDGSTAGKITGTPKAAGSSELTFQVTDPLGGAARKNLILTILRRSR